MKKTLFQKVLCLILSVTTLFGVIAVTASAAETDRGTNRDTASSLEEMKQLVGVSSYDEYLEEYGPAIVNPNAEIVKIDITGSLVAGSSAQTPDTSEECQDAIEEDKARDDADKLWSNFGEENGLASVYLPSSGQSTWTFEIDDEASGYYYIKIVYYSCETSESSISSIERKLLIDGAPAFDESSYITLNKSWEFTYIDETVTQTTESDYYEVRYVDEAEDGYQKIVTTVKTVSRPFRYTLSPRISTATLCFPTCRLFLPGIPTTARTPPVTTRASSSFICSTALIRSLLRQSASPLSSSPSSSFPLATRRTVTEPPR